MKIQFLSFLFVFVSLTAFSQISGTSKTVIIKGVSKIDPRKTPTSFAPSLKNLEAPKPGGNSYHDFINAQKIKSAKQFGNIQNKKNATDGIQYGDAENAAVVDEMGMRSYIAQIDKEGIYYGGTPLDNTLAFSPNYLLGSVNSFLWGHDLTNDTTLFTDLNGSTTRITFAEFGKDYITDPLVEAPFDPKLIYIPQFDKFVFLFLSGRKPTDSKIIIGFSSTNDPRDPWNVYMIPGNPRNLDQWSDFPMAAFDPYDLFLSINMLKANTSWQEGFRGSIVWQIPFNEGFNGDSILSLTMYDDILYGGNNIRNLTPIQQYALHQPYSSQGMTFLSDRNFDIQNDSLFIVQIGIDKTLTTHVRQLPQPYGMPPNGIQADDNPNDETDGLQTNDARFLAAVGYTNSNNEQYVEFVGNTKNFANNRVGIYHGIIKGVNITDPESSTITTNIISVDSLDFGYPNIVYTHNGQYCHEGTFIAFNHTSATTFAGVSGIRHTNFDGYSDIIRLKEGDDYVRRISGSYERWGDYFGLQTMVNRPFEIWTAGFYGTTGRKSSTWFSKIAIPDSTRLRLLVLENDWNEQFTCNTTQTWDAFGGLPPYSFLWDDGSTNRSRTFNICNGYSITVTDAKGCTETSTDTPIDNKMGNLYPNPTADMVTVTFQNPSETDGSFGIYDITGKLIFNIGTQTILEGKNVFTFSAAPLQKGAYFLLIKDNEDNNIIQKRFVKL